MVNFYELKIERADEALFEIITCESRIGVEKVVPEILGRGGTVSDAATSSILYHGMKPEEREE